MEVPRVYVDYQATTPVEKEVADAIYTALTVSWGNPSSNHAPGKAAREVIENARLQIGKMINSPADDVIFTSGGTESNNMVLWSAVRFYHDKYKEDTSSRIPHILTSALEHDSISKLLDYMEREKIAEVTSISAAKKNGQVLVEDFLDNIRPNTCLITLMMANNETGVIQPVKDLVKRVRAVNQFRGAQPVLLHTDAGQAIGKIEVDVQDLDVDYLTVVGHKFYGPRIGALYVRDKSGSTPLYPMLHGGGQEKNLRPGTENTAMIAGLGKAAELVYENLKMYNERMSSLQCYFEEQLTGRGGDHVTINGKHDDTSRIPSVCNFSFLALGCHGYKILEKCPRVQASVGAACHSGQIGLSGASPILLASGVPEDIAKNAIRISFGRATTRLGLDTVISDLLNAYCVMTNNI